MMDDAEVPSLLKQLDRDFDQVSEHHDFDELLWNDERDNAPFMDRPEDDFFGIEKEPEEMA